MGPQRRFTMELLQIQETTNSTFVPFTGNQTTENTDTKTVIIQVVQVLIALLVYIGNFLIIFVTPRLKRTKRTSRYLMLHLAAADLLIALSVTIRVAIVLSGYKRNEVLVCQLVLSFIVMSCGNSATGIMFLSLDIFASIKAGISLQNRSILTTRVTLVMIVTSWVIWIFVSCIKFALTPVTNSANQPSDLDCQIGNGYYPRAYDFILTLGTMGIYLITVLILIKAVKMLKLASLVSSPPQNTTQSPENNTQQHTFSTNPTISHGKLQRFRAMTKIVTLTLVLFGVCWLPILSLILLNAIHPPLQNAVGAFQQLLGLPALGHSILNIGIYYYKNKEFQFAIRRMCCNRTNVVHVLTTDASTRTVMTDNPNSLV